LANFESGRRPTVSIAEVLVFARALNVPPLLLVFPLGQEESPEVLPDESAPVWAAAQWFTGESDRLPGDTKTTSDTGVVRLYRDHDRLVEEWRNARNQVFSILAAKEPRLEQFRGAGIPIPDGYDTKFLELFLREMQNAQNAVRLVRQKMRDQVLTPPDLGPVDTAVLDGSEDMVQELYVRAGLQPPQSGSEETGE
jgi:hypothetical protein